MKNWLFIASVVFLAACSGVDQGHLMVMNYYVGKPEKILLSSWGKPLETKRIDSKTKTYTYKDPDGKKCVYSFNVVRKKVAGWYQEGKKCPKIIK